MEKSIPIEIACRRGCLLEQILKHARDNLVDAIILGWRRPLWPRKHLRLADQRLQKSPCEVILVSDIVLKSVPAALWTVWSQWICGLGWPIRRAAES